MCKDTNIDDRSCKHLRLEEMDSIRIKRFRCKDCGMLLYRRATAYGGHHENLSPYSCNFTQMRDTPKGRRRIRVCDNAARHWDGAKAWCHAHTPLSRGAAEEERRLACEAAADAKRDSYLEEHKAFSSELRVLLGLQTAATADLMQPCTEDDDFFSGTLLL